MKKFSSSCGRLFYRSPLIRTERVDVSAAAVVVVGSDHDAGCYCYSVRKTPLNKPEEENRKRQDKW